MLNPAITQDFKVKHLLALGGKRWAKNGLDRIYLDVFALHQLLGAEVGYYSSNSLKNCKYYYDLAFDTYGYKHCEGCVDLHDSIYKKLDEYLTTKYDARQAVKAEHDITLDEIDAVLGF